MSYFMRNECFIGGFVYVLAGLGGQPTASVATGRLLAGLDIFNKGMKVEPDFGCFLDTTAPPHC